MGASSPSSRRRVATASGVALSPSMKRAESPGRSSRTKNTTRLAARRLASRETARPARYRVMGRAFSPAWPLLRPTYPREVRSLGRRVDPHALEVDMLDPDLGELEQEGAHIVLGQTPLRRLPERNLVGRIGRIGDLRDDRVELGVVV